MYAKVVDARKHPFPAPDARQRMDFALVQIVTKTQIVTNQRACGVKADLFIQVVNAHSALPSALMGAQLFSIRNLNVVEKLQLSRQPI